MRRWVTAVVLAAASAASACAGSLDRYRAGLPAPGGGAATPEVAIAGAGSADGAGVVAPSVTAPTARFPVGVPVLDDGARPSSVSGTSTETLPDGAISAGSGAPAATSDAVQGPMPSGPASAAGTGAPAAGSDGRPVASRPGTTTGITRDSVIVGLFMPKTGAYTGLARNADDVLEAAFAEAGPIHGRKLVVRTYDDGTSNPSTIQVEEKRARDEAFGLISVVAESNVILAPLADSHQVPLIVGNIDQQVALPLTYTFPLFTFIERQATILPNFIRNELGGGEKRIGVVYEGTSTVKNAKEAFKAKAADTGLRVVFEQPIAQNQSSCANEVSNLQANRVELVVMINGPLGGICMLRDARALNYRPMWTGGLGWNFNVVAAASGDGAEGIRTLTSITTLETPAGQRYVEAMRRYAPHTGAEEDDLMLLVYGLAQTLVEALRRTGPDLTREAFVQTMETKINGYDSGYLPPPTFGPGNRSGPLLVGVSACCSNRRWTIPQIGWRADF